MEALGASSNNNYYSHEEKNFILELVKERSHVIEHQENSVVINRKKNDEWKNITAEMNAKYNGNRSLKRDSSLPNQ